MMISRRPNKRQSTERAPGPRNASAVPTTATSTAGNGESNKFRLGAGSHESAMPALAAATSPPATGVRNPIKSEIPLPATANPAAQISAVGLPWSARYATPWTTAIVPAAPRKSSKPTPGHPPGNVENNRCSSCLLGGQYRRPRSPLSRVTATIVKRITSARNLSLPLLGYRLETVVWASASRPTPGAFRPSAIPSRWMPETPRSARCPRVVRSARAAFAPPWFSRSRCR